MATNYDTLYKSTPNALGPPTAVILEWFQSLQKSRLSILDIGCGQGRDAIPLARLGHQIVGVDISANGVSQMKADAQKDNLDITGHVADIRDYRPERSFDVVLIDRTLHMLDAHEMNQVFDGLLDAVRPHGYCLLVDEPSNMLGFQSVAEHHAQRWNAARLKPGVMVFSRLT